MYFVKRIFNSVSNILQINVLSIIREYSELEVAINIVITYWMCIVYH